MELGGGGEGEGEGAAAGEDLLSALPDDVLILILLKLSTDAAAQTRVLSHRWHRVWALLPRLWLFKPPEPHQLRDAEPPEPHWLRDTLDLHNVLLRDLVVWAGGATPESLAVWLPAAARRVSGRLLIGAFHHMVEDVQDYDSEEEEAAQRAAFELPCFDKATEIHLSLRYQSLAVPVTGVFARLTDLHLSRVWFHGPGELGDAVSSPRCPCLKRLAINDSRGLRDLAIHSESILWMELSYLHTLSRLIVVAPTLKELTVKFCFVKSPPFANISAPLLLNLVWDDEYDPNSVHIGKMAHLQRLGDLYYFVYGGSDGFQHLLNQDYLSLLQRFEAIERLSLALAYPRTQGIENCEYLMEYMAVLPDIKFLCLRVKANGHAFGASTFHVLRLCTSIRRLELELADTISEAQAVCSSDCICVQLVEWETEELFMNHLEEVKISGCRGTEHEVAFVKRLFDWGTKLKEMTVHLCDLISKVKAKELYQTFQSFSRPGICMKFYHWHEHRRVLYAPKD